MAVVMGEVSSKYPETVVVYANRVRPVFKKKKLTPPTEVPSEKLIGTLIPDAGRAVTYIQQDIVSEEGVKRELGVM